MRQNRLVALREAMAEDVVAPRVAEAEMPADLRVDALAALSDDVADPLVVGVVAREQRQPRAEILELEIRRAGLDERFHLGVENRRERVAQLLRVLVVLEVDVPGEVDRAGADRDLDRPVGVLRGDLVEIGEADRAALDLAAVDHAAPVGEQLDDLVARLGSRLERMRLARGVEARDAFVHVPAERADHADVVVVRHLPVGHDVEPGLLLIVDHREGRVVVGLLVPDLLERDPDIAAEQLLVVPVRPRVRPDHRGRENRVDDLPGHRTSSVTRHVETPDASPWRARRSTRSSRELGVRATPSCGRPAGSG